MSDWDDITSPLIAIEVEASAELIHAMVPVLRRLEGSLRSIGTKVRGGARLPASAVAAELRTLADILIERAGRLHESARKLEPEPRRRKSGTGHHH